MLHWIHDHDRDEVPGEEVMFVALAGAIVWAILTAVVIAVIEYRIIDKAGHS